MLGGAGGARRSPRTRPWAHRLFARACLSAVPRRLGDCGYLIAKTPSLFLGAPRPKKQKSLGVLASWRSSRLRSTFPNDALEVRCFSSRPSEPGGGARSRTHVRRR